MRLPHNLVGRTFIVVATSVALYAVLAIWTGWDDLRSQLARFPLAYVLPLVLLSLVNYGLRFWRWQRWLLDFDVRLPLRASLVLYFATYVMVITPGKIGEVFKAGILKERYGVSLSIGLPIVLAERIFDFLAILLLAAISFPTWQGPLANLGTGLAVLALIPLALLAFRSEGLRTGLIRRATAMKGLQQYHVGVTESVDALTRLLDVRAGTWALIISTVAWSCECLSLWLVCQALGVDLGILPSCFVYAAATLVGSLTFLPGGLGGTEGTIIWLLTTHSVASVTAVTAALVVRLVTLWLAVAIGLAVFLPNRRTFLGGPADTGTKASAVDR